MCGIVGVVGNKGSENLINAMVKSQSHRGPDYSGIWRDDQVFFGHNRLSIIDLSTEANQPFVSDRYILVFNGEIYNYIELKAELNEYEFKTNSDTEVLIAAYIKWGKQCLSRLNGMFSFAIWDTKDKTLFAARDRFGVKPFYYHFSNNTFYFSSEIKALHAASIKKEPNKKVWFNYIASGSYGMPNETFWNEIEQLQGGHYLEFIENKLTIEKWYFFEEEIKKHKKEQSFDEVKKQYKELLLDSIKIRFRSDVKVGFNISGGLDSSVLLALVNQLEKKSKINAFTFYTNNQKYDELPWVEEMIALTNNPLEKVLLRPDEEFKNKLLYISKIQDEPFGGIPTIAYSEIFKQARSKENIVLLDGQGMDEQWAGYDYYVQNNDSTIQGVSKSPFRPNMLSKKAAKFIRKANYPKHFESEVLNKQYRDLFYTKIPRALRFNDRVSMAYSTELREPFLDYRLVELAFAQPLKYKIHNGIQKYLLRELVSEYLSDGITYAPKRPLQTPQREWMGKELKEFIDETIVDLKNSEYSEWFNIDEIENEWNLYLLGDKDSSFHIWQILSLRMLFDNE